MLGRMTGRYKEFLLLWGKVEVMLGRSGFGLVGKVALKIGTLGVLVRSLKCYTKPHALFLCQVMLARYDFFRCSELLLFEVQVFHVAVGPGCNRSLLVLRMLGQIRT